MEEYPGVVVVGRIIMGLGVLLGVILQRRALRRRPAEGTVVELTQGVRGHGDNHAAGLAPVVEFQPHEGPSQRFVGVYSSPPGYTVGQKVKVRYEPANPEQAFLDYGPLGVWGPAAGVVALGVALLLLARW